MLHATNLASLSRQRIYPTTIWCQRRYHIQTHHRPTGAELDRIVVRVELVNIAVDNLEKY